MSRRAVFVAAVAAFFIVAAPDAAHAHTRTEETTSIDSRITHAPALDGVDWTVYTGGQLVEVRNHSEADLVVYGYDGEPYLRIGPDGVHRNRRSPATYLNDDRYGDVAIPPTVDSVAEPEWRRISGEPEWRWHDHRTHWMSPEPPSFVSAGPLIRGLMRAELVGPIGSADAGVFTTWTLPFRYDGADLAVGGELIWVPAPDQRPALALGALLLAAAAFWVVRRRREGRVGAAALIVAAIAVLGATSLVDDLLAWPEDLLDDLFGVLHTALFVGVGLAGAAWARYGREGRRLALGIGSGALLYHQGIVHLPLLLASQFPTVWPPALIRFVVVLSLAQALLVAVVLAVQPARTSKPVPVSSTVDPNDRQAEESRSTISARSAPAARSVKA